MLTAQVIVLNKKEFKTRATEETRTEFDDDNNGTIGRVEIDRDGDGTPDRIKNYTYNASGRLIRTNFDDTANGFFNRAELCFYNGDGTLRQTDFDDDNDADGNTDRTLRFDADGNVTRREAAADDDGAADRTEAYTHDASGNLLQTMVDRDGDGTIDRVETYTLDASGNRTRTDVDDADGTTDRSGVDNNVNGIFERIEYTWYPGGTADVYRRDEDTDDDGDLDQVQYEGDVDYSEEFPNHAGLEVVLLSGVGGGDGVTELTIPDEFVFAGNTVPGSRVRIEGGVVDTLRFDPAFPQ